MNKIIGFVQILFVLFSCLLLTACQQKAAIDEQSQGILVIGVTGQSYPNSYYQDGKLVGFDVEISQAIAKQLGMSIRWVVADFSGLMGQLQAGRLDTVANAVAIIAERQKTYNFTIPYSYYASQIVTNKANPYYRWQDLKGKTIAGVLGSNHIKNLAVIFSPTDINIRTYETRDAAIMDVIKNRVDGYVNSQPILAMEIHRHNLPLKFVGGPLVIEAVGYPFAKNQRGQVLLKKFNQAIQVLQNSQQLRQLSEKYFAENIRNCPQIIQKMAIFD